MVNLKQIKKFLIDESKSLKDGIVKLNKYGKRILFVIDEQKKIVGSLSDGDIRKALLKGSKLHQPLKKIINRKFIFIKKKNELKIKIKILKKNNIIYIPVCDKNKRIKEILNVNNLYSLAKIKTPFIILAGGRGQRMMPLTLNKPKPLVKIYNKPILEHIILNAKKQGFENFVISLGYKGEKIKRYFKDGTKLGIKINYVSEKKPLGTAGFLGLLDMKEKDFFVINGDIITKVDFKNMLQFHLKNKSFATMAIKKKLNNEKFGVVKTNGIDFLNVSEKPLITYNINSGIYLLNKKVINYVSKNKKIEMTDLFNNLKKKQKKISVFPIFENWLDLANSNDLIEANRHLKK